MSIFNNTSNVSLKYSYESMKPGGDFPLPEGADPTNGYTFLMCKDKGTAGYLQFNNSWTKSVFPNETLVIGNGSLFKPVYNAGNGEIKYPLYYIDYDKVGTATNPRTCRIVTKPFIFTSIAYVKELVALRLSLEGSGLMPTLYVDRQKNLHSPKLRVKIEPWVDRDGYVIYYLREVGEYKYLTFTIEWTNTDTDYILKISAISLLYKTLKAKTR